MKPLHVALMLMLAIVLAIFAFRSPSTQVPGSSKPPPVHVVRAEPTQKLPPKKQKAPDTEEPATTVIVTKEQDTGGKWPVFEPRTPFVEPDIYEGTSGGISVAALLRKEAFTDCWFEYNTADDMALHKPVLRLSLLEDGVPEVTISGQRNDTTKCMTAVLDDVPFEPPEGTVSVLWPLPIPDTE